MKFVFALFLLAVAGTAGSGCAPVKPYQREDLSLRPMRPTAEASEDRFRAHWQSSREGSEGGFGAAGGGCGCN
ncbi:MAG TPA: DUF4266 domain-containing protein [Polyangia bacterium]|jgi:hypothetical protein